MSILMILVTGSAGKTGLAVIGELASRGEAVRALIHKEAHREIVSASGTQEIIQGDLLAPDQIKAALKGVNAVYHICPNVHPQEVEIGEILIRASQQVGVEHFVYHSVLHPQLEAMPHHWLKMRVEELLIESGLDFTILQPTAYMHNVIAQLKNIDNELIYQVPYSIETRLCLVDLLDVAQVAGIVLTNPEHKGAVYELVGTEIISQIEVASEISNQLGYTVPAVQISIEDWKRQAEKEGLGKYQISTLIKMFNHYQKYRFPGNTNTLGWLLGRPPISLADFIRTDIFAADQF